MTTELHPAVPLDGVTAAEERPKPERQPPGRQRKSWREQRWQRRKRRRFFEEVLGWILVPVILITGYWAVRSGLNALGTSPTALVQGIKAALSGKS